MFRLDKIWFFFGIVRVEGMLGEGMRDEIGEEGKGIFNVFLKDFGVIRRREFISKGKGSYWIE